LTSRCSSPGTYSIYYLRTRYQNQASAEVIAVDRLYAHTNAHIAFYSYILHIIGFSDALVYDSYIIVLNPACVQVCIIRWIFTIVMVLSLPMRIICHRIIVTIHAILRRMYWIYRRPKINIGVLRSAELKKIRRLLSLLFLFKFSFCGPSRRELIR